MTAFFRSLFSGQPASPCDRARIGALSGTVGILCNLLLAAAKLFAGILTGAVSITADALNNLSDASASLVTLLGFHLARKPADEDHPYGHARYEYLTGLAVSVLILFIGYELAKTSVLKILSPEPVVFSAAAVGILIASILVKLWLSFFNRRLGNQIHSTALLAAAADSRNDCIATAAVLISGLLEHAYGLRCDGFMGLGVAIFILYSGIRLARDTISPLLGENADPELRHRISSYILSQPKVLGYHDLMIHDYGPEQRFASLHVEMDHREDPLVCHQLIDRMEHNCLRNFHVHLVIHYDPIITDDPELTALKERLSQNLQEYDHRLSLHDLRIIPGRRHKNLIFDISLPEGLRGMEEEITAWLEGKLRSTESEEYHLLITYELSTFNS